MVKIRIPIQSVSDIITNSSSEVFCRISSEDYLDKIWDILEPLFHTYSDRELYPNIEEKNLDEEKEYLTVEEIKELPYRWIEVSLPYCMSDSQEFYKAGLESILTKNFGDNYKISYVTE